MKSSDRNQVCTEQYCNYLISFVFPDESATLVDLDSDYRYRYSRRHHRTLSPVLFLVSEGKRENDVDERSCLFRSPHRVPPSCRYRTRAPSVCSGSILNGLVSLYFRSARSPTYPYMTRFSFDRESPPSVYIVFFHDDLKLFVYFGLCSTIFIFIFSFKYSLNFIS